MVHFPTGRHYVHVLTCYATACCWRTLYSFSDHHPVCASFHHDLQEHIGLCYILLLDDIAFCSCFAHHLSSFSHLFTEASLTGCTTPCCWTTFLNIHVFANHHSSFSHLSSGTSLTGCATSCCWWTFSRMWLTSSHTQRPWPGFTFVSWLSPSFCCGWGWWRMPVPLPSSVRSGTFIFITVLHTCDVCVC